MTYVYSTLSGGNLYVNYKQGGADIPVPIKIADKDGKLQDGVHIKGGANVADARGDTYKGVVTEVTDDQMAYLLDNPGFQQHVDGKFVVFSDKKQDAEKVAADKLEEKDAGAPKTADDFKDTGLIPTVEGKVDNKKAGE